MVVVLLANGFEELEALTPVDVLRRNDVDIRTVSITSEKLVTGTHGIQVAADLLWGDVPLDDIDMLVLPGGMPGVKNLEASAVTQAFIHATLKNGGHLAAICAAPSIFGKHGMLTNIKATCFPGFEGDLLNAILTDCEVVTDGVFTTARDYKAAGAFAEELVKMADILGIKPHSEDEEEPMQNDADKVAEDSKASETEGESAPFLNDQKFTEAIETAIDAGKVSVSMLQRKLFIGYARASEYLDAMEKMGIVSPLSGNKPRDVLISKASFEGIIPRKKAK